MTEGEPDKKIILAKTTSQKEKKGVKQNSPRNKMNPYLLFYCIPIVIVLCFLPSYLTKIQSRYSYSNDGTTIDAFTKHYYFFENQMPPLKIYVYNKTEPDQSDLVIKKYGSNPPHEDKFSDQSEEIIIRETLKNPENNFLIETNPEKADIFYAPFYLSICAMMIRSPTKRDFFKYYEPLLNSMGPYYKRYGGVDHVLTQMSAAYHIRSPISLYNMNQIPVMASMADVPYDLTDRELWHFTQYIHGTNAPLYADDSENLTYEIDSDSNPNKRTTSLLFIGKLDMMWNNYGTQIRHGLAAQMPDIPLSFSLSLENDAASVALESTMYEKMRSSQICIEPAGDSPTYRSLTDAFLSNCVPIVFSDKAFFPFEDVFVNYRKIVFQVNMAETYLLKSKVNMANFGKLKNARIAMRQIGHLWKDSKSYKINKGESFWGWLWMQFFQNSVVAASKRRCHQLIPPYVYED